MAYYSVDDYDGDNETFENDDQNIYVVKWLNDCYRTLALPNPLTEKLARKVNNQLANKVKGQIDNSVKVQLLYLLLGKDYMKANFPQCKHDPLLLEQPKMMPETKMAMLDDMRSWLINQLYTIKHELGYDRSAETGTAPAELVSFQDEAQLVYTRELNNRVEELKANSMDNMSKGSSYLDPKTVVLGEALLAVGFRDPFEMAHILKTLQQTFFPLPGRLRSYVWSEFLFLRKGIKSNLIQSNIMKKTRLKFQLAVEDNSQNRKQSILQSEINKQIEDEVMGVYNHNLSLRSTDTDYHLLQAVKVLNLLYTYSQNFSSLYIYWLYPLQFCIDLDNIDEDEKLYHLAFHLDFFVTECPLSQSELFNTADQVLDSLKKLDPFLHEYLYDVCSKQVIADPKDFPEECYHLDKAEARKIYSEIAMVSETDVPPSRLAIIGDPAIFIRKWLATAFVSALTQPALFLFWDYMFLGKWDRRRLQDICLILLGLLKNWFYKAKNFDEIRQVFFDEPSRLYTNDIRSSWLHWQNQGSFDAIPNMNHNCIDSNLDDGGVFTDDEENENAAVLANTSKLALKSKPKKVVEDGEDVSDVSDSDDDNPQPSRAFLSVTSPREPSPLPDEFAAWIPFNTDIMKTIPVAESIAETFDIYVDGVRFVPDNATIVKVVGKIYNIDLGTDASVKLVSPEILAFPELDFGYQTPYFSYRVVVNRENMVPNPEALLMLQVHTLERSTGSIVILGTSVMGIFDTTLKKPLLKFGGHQLRLYYGPPITSANPEEITEELITSSPIVPGVTVLIRLLPHTEGFIEAPIYESAYYQSDSCRPLVSEWKLFKHYLLSPDKFLTVRHVTLKLLRSARHIGRVSDEDLKEWIALKLDSKTTDEGLKILDFIHFTHYEIDCGIAMQIKKVHFLPEYQDNHYIQVLVRILPGRASRWRFPMPEGWGGEEKFMTQNLNFRSFMRSPSWLDQSQILHPYYDDYSVFLIELYGVQVTYIRDQTGGGYGTILPKEGTEMSVSLEKPMAWTMLQVFDRGSVNGGYHVCPLIKGKLPRSLIDMLRVECVEDVLSEALRTDMLEYHDGSSIEIALWDGNFLDNEHPPLTKFSHMLEIGGIRDIFQLTYQFPETTEKLLWIVASAFSQTGIDLKSEAFKYEVELFAELMLRIFTKIMNNALLREGLKPLPE